MNCRRAEKWEKQKSGESGNEDSQVSFTRSKGREEDSGGGKREKVVKERGVEREKGGEVVEVEDGMELLGVPNIAEFDENQLNLRVGSEKEMLLL